jgi:hypothetical protein
VGSLTGTKYLVVAFMARLPASIAARSKNFLVVMVFSDDY